MYAPPAGSLTTSTPQPIYHRIAARRAAHISSLDRADLIKAGVEKDPVAAVKKVVEGRRKMEFGDEREGVEGRRVRPGEDPVLVGEGEAERCRRERGRREGWEVLEREDRRWEWMIGLCSFFFLLVGGRFGVWWGQVLGWLEEDGGRKRGEDSEMEDDGDNALGMNANGLQRKWMTGTRARRGGRNLLNAMSRRIRRSRVLAGTDS